MSKVQLRKVGNKEVPVGDSTFIVRVLDAEEEAKINDELFNMDETRKIKMSVSSVSFAIAKAALIGWKNVVDADGKDVEFSTAKIKLLPSTTLTTISEAARGDKLGEEEEKNSERLSSSNSEIVEQE